jgi:hypothetical protein
VLAGAGYAAGGVGTTFAWPLSHRTGKAGTGVISGEDGPDPLASIELDPGLRSVTWTNCRNSRLAVRDLRPACSCRLCHDEATGSPLVNLHR